MAIDFTTNEGKLLLIILVCAIIYGLFKALSRKEWSVKEQDEEKYTGPVHIKPTEKKWTPSGWYYDEEKEKWISPDYTNSKANTKIPKFRTPEELEQAKLLHIDRSEPTYEEWKAARLKERQNNEK